MELTPWETTDLKDQYLAILKQLKYTNQLTPSLFVPSLLSLLKHFRHQQLSLSKQKSNMQTFRLNPENRIHIFHYNYIIDLTINPSRFPSE